MAVWGLGFVFGFVFGFCWCGVWGGFVLFAVGLGGLLELADALVWGGF